MRKSIAYVLAAALALSACGGGGGGEVAATVGDAELTVADVQAFPFEESGTIESAQFAQYLGALIQWQILDAAAASDFGIDPSEEEVEEELNSVLENQANGMTLSEVAESQNLSEETVRKVIRVGLIQRLVSDALPEPTDEEVANALESESADITEVCARHVLVETVEDAETARQRLADGEDFAAVAGEVSTDPSAAQNGGDLGCAPAGQYVPEFRDAAVAAEIDELTDPVETQFGFHVIQVYDRTDPSQDDVRELLSSRALEDWLVEQVTQAEVSVEEEYGTWTTDPTPGVTPPAT